MTDKTRQQEHLLWRKKKDKISSVIFFLGNLIGILFLGILLLDILRDGWKWLDWDFITSFPSRFAAKAGIFPAVIGSLWLMVLTLIFAVPVGIATAVYLEEFASKGFLTSLIQTNISNLAGVPSIVYGILGLAVFVRGIGLGRTVLAGALTMSLLILPVIIITAQEAIKTTPETIKHASYALGATKWQTVRRVVLPYAAPGILTGTILATSRAIGETAPMIIVGAAAYVSFIPTSPFDGFTVLPMQIFNWASRPQKDFLDLAAAGIIVLLSTLLSLNAAAILLRNKFQKRYEGL